MSKAAQNTSTNVFLSVLKTESGAGTPPDSATNSCQLFNVATDFTEVSCADSTGAERYERTWLRDPISCRLGNLNDRAQPDDGDDSPANLLQSPPRFAQQLDAQVEALVLSNSAAKPAYDTEVLLRRLLATVFGQAAAANTIAKQYARATNLIRVEVCSALGRCHAQCNRLRHSRQAYISSLRRLNTIQKTTLVHQQPCVFCKGSLLKDLVEFERLRSTAKRLHDSRHLIESLKLNKQQEACRKASGQRIAANSNALEKYFLAEKAALQLLHASRLLNVQETLAVLHQSCPVEAYAARKILRRVEEEIPDEMRLCAEESTREECERQHGNAEAVKPPTRSAFAAESCDSSVCVASLVRLFHLENRLSRKFSADTKRLLHLARLARNFADALQHLEQFLDSVLGPLWRASYTDGTNDSCQYMWEGDCIEQSTVFLEKCSDASKDSVRLTLECPRRGQRHCQAVAQSRLSMIGVAFFNGALRRTQRSSPSSVTFSSCLRSLKSSSAEHSSDVSEALMSSLGDARTGVGTAQVALHPSSCGAIYHLQSADEAYRDSRSPADVVADKGQDLPLPSSDSKKAAFSPRELPSCHEPEIQNGEPLLRRVTGIIGCADRYTNTHCQLEKGGTRRGLPGTVGELHKPAPHALNYLCSKTGDTPTVQNLHGIPDFEARPESPSLECKTSDDSEASSGRARFERAGNTSQQSVWHRRRSFISLLKTTKEKLGSASDEIFNRYYGNKKSVHSASSQGSWKTSSTFVELPIRLASSRSDRHPHHRRSRTRNGLQNLIESVGKRSCRRLVRQWVTMKGREPRTPRDSGRGLWKHRCETLYSHKILPASPLESEKNGVKQ